MAMGYVKLEHASAGSELKVEILGDLYDAVILGSPAYDANGFNMRS
jgi:dimethylglycine dehydrogenase